jgi:ABC-type amino acid transport substrate-binding protein
MNTRPISNLQSPLARRSLFTGSLLIVSLFIALVSCARPDDAWERIRAGGVLRVGMDASFPPFESVAADGTLAGFDIDLARELGRRLGPALSGAEGVEVQFVANLPYDGLYDALAVDRVDVVISALVVNPARMADYAYSTPYFDAGQVLVVREGANIETMDDLEGYTLAVEFGTQGDMEARKRARKVEGLAIAPYQTAAEALAAVAAGEADAALVDHVSALAASNLVIAGEPVTAEPYAVAVHQDSRHLLQAIDAALAEMQADGTLDALTTKWLVGSQ